jgi:hypothetical protein
MKIILWLLFLSILQFFLETRYFVLNIATSSSLLDGSASIITVYVGKDEGSIPGREIFIFSSPLCKDRFRGQTVFNQCV